MFIRSERLFLRPGWPEDWQELLTRIADEAVLRNLSRAPWPYTAENAREFTGMPQDARRPHFLITLPGAQCPGQIVGAVGLAERDDGTELGYWIARDHWGRGFATEAASAVLRLARTLGHRRLLGCHFADNPASGRVLRKVGFRPTGKIAPRFSLARGGEVMAVEHAFEFGGKSDCDGGDDGNPVMRAA